MNFISLFRPPNSTPEALINVQVSKSAILHNLNEFRKLSPLVAPVLKSNGFGHGLIEVACILQNETTPFFIVDTLEESIILRNNKINNPILTIGYVPCADKEDYNLPHVSYTITSYEMLLDWSQNIKTKTKVHLKIDTGMNRQGISLSKINDAIEILTNSQNLELEGICTHLADADNSDTSFTNQQIQIWNSYTDIFKRKFDSIKYFHISNTPGHGHLKNAVSSFSRLGVGLYGLSGNGNLDSRITLKPAMKITTIITGTKIVEKGAKIGYNGTSIADSSMRIATIPIGYGVGYDRRLSNNGFVKIGESFTPILGKISMNITTIDVTNINAATFKSEVVVISNNEQDVNSVINIAKMCQTNPHEIVTNISPYLKRIIQE